MGVREGRGYRGGSQSANPRANASAALSRAMSPSLSRPMRPPTRSRRTVTGLSAMICDRPRNPFTADGSTVTRRSGASTTVVVIWQIITEACSAGSASLCTTTAGRGLPKSPLAATVTTSPRRMLVELGDVLDPGQRGFLAPGVQALHLFGDTAPDGFRSRVRHGHPNLPQPGTPTPLPHPLHALGG